MSATRKPPRSTCSTAESGKLIKEIKLTDRPNNIAVSKNGDRVAIAIARGKGGLDIVDTKTMTLKKWIPNGGGRLHNVYITPDGKYVIGGSIPSKKFYAFDLDKEELAWDLQMDLGVRPMAIEANPDGSTKRVFIQMSELNGFSVVDFAQRKEVTKVPLPEPPEQFDHGGYRTNEPSHGISVSPDNKTLWVTSIPNNAVYAYSLDNLEERRPRRAAGLQGRRKERVALGCRELDDLHAGRQVPLHLQRRLALDLGGRRAEHEVRQVDPGRRGAEAHQYDGHQLTRSSSTDEASGIKMAGQARPSLFLGIGLVAGAPLCRSLRVMAGLVPATPIIWHGRAPISGSPGQARR